MTTPTSVPIEGPLELEAWSTNGQREHSTVDVATPIRAVPDRTDLSESPLPDVAELLKGRLIKPTHFVAGVVFEIGEWRGQVVLSKEVWSLMGRGRNLAEAEMNLIRNAREDAQYFLRRPVQSMTQAALELRDFILCVL